MNDIKNTLAASLNSPFLSNGDSYTNSTLCSKCGGECCKTCGCHFSPADFADLSIEAMTKELEKGYISIDKIPVPHSYDGYFFYYLRIRNQNAPIVDLDASIPNRCILHTDNGCKLDFSDRPHGGKLLIPHEEFDIDNSLKITSCLACYSLYNRSDCYKDWLPHQKMLEDLITRFKERDIPSIL